jgi:hypothetical protein
MTKLLERQLSYSGVFLVSSRPPLPASHHALEFVLNRMQNNLPVLPVEFFPGKPERPTSPTPPWMAARMMNAPKETVASSSEATASPSARSRGSKSTMPVGLDWLAEEP